MEYTVETLAHGTKVCINKTHRFGTDAFLLSHFAEVKYAQKALDMGTGCGIIPLRWKDMGHKGEAFGLEIDPQGTQLMKKSIELNGLENLTAICGDVREFKTEKADFDVITCNPPYVKNNSAIKNETDTITISRHEVLCDLEDVIRVSAQLLIPKGRFYMVHRPSRLADIMCLMRQYKIEPKKLRFVAPRKGKEPNLLLVEGIFGGGEELKLMEQLYIFDENGDYSEEVNKIYNRS